ncbi:putative ATP-dependent RNA helicase DDX20 [Taenia crassiceps]|uniref:RNA helicase n=1 Tax=Taenia crassiceps TaxID=6207 RepID=A0ABR4QN77_9CEST
MADSTAEESEEMRVAHQLDFSERTEDVIPLNDLLSHTPALSFADMGLSVDVLQGLQTAGFRRPSPVQVKAIPLGRLGVDMIVQAKSGTGKTVVFAVITLEAIDVKKKGVQAIVISPTREIAFQSASVIRQLGHFITGLKVQLFVGGIPLSEDVKHVDHCHVAVGTPGRLKYLISAGHINCENIRLLVLDEADLLFSGGAGPDVTDTELLAGKNTFPAAINYIWSPALVRLSSDDPSLLGVRQFFHKVSTTSASPAAVFKAKVKELLRIIKELDFKQCLIFSNFHNSAEQLCKSLRGSGWPVTYISSGLEQKERFKAFNSLRTFQCRILVSTDLTSRGIDAENVNLVINLEVPWNRDVYLHRIGRAGRFGSYGASILLVADTLDEVKLLSRIEETNSTPIHQLPEPLPVDLATAECPVDISKLVTVTKLATTMERESHGSSRPETIKRVTKTLSVKRAPREPNASGGGCPVKGSNLIENLALYTEAVLKRSSIRVHLSTDEGVGETVEKLGPTTDMENNILRWMSEFLGSDSIISAAEKEENEAWNCRLLSSSEEEGKEPETYKQHINVAVADAATSTEQLSLSLSPRQLALWNEYCRLVGWKDYFYQAWWNTTQEYEAVLSEFRKMASQMNQTEV